VDDSVLQWAGERGYRVAWGSLEIVGSACSDLVARREARELDEELFREVLAPVSSPELPEWAASVIVVATPRPAFRVGFDLGDRVLETILPPTYRRYRATFEEVRQDLQANALPGARIEQIKAPLKAVATRLGLVRYGRNNITYAGGIGSFLQLCGYLTDANLDCEVRSPQAPMLLDECDGCDTCSLACPTGAIDPDRVLLHAERCLTFVNERPAPWPPWLPATAHHCLIGCLACQRCCPANPELEIRDSGVTFSADETRLLLEEGTSASRRNEDSIQRTLGKLGLSEEPSLLGRNLRALLERRVQDR
jgi:epoxyqueuosine reductase